MVISGMQSHWVFKIRVDLDRSELNLLLRLADTNPDEAIMYFKQQEHLLLGTITTDPQFVIQFCQKCPKVLDVIPSARMVLKMAKTVERGLPGG